MNLLNLLGEITTYSNYALIGLADVVHISCPIFDVMKLDALPPHTTAGMSETKEVSEQTVLSDQTPLYRLLYIHKGSIQFRMDPQNKTAVLPSGSLLFRSCHRELRFRVVENDLEAWVFYLHGNSLPYYNEMIEPTDSSFLPSGTSGTIRHTHNLIQINKSRSLADELLVNNLVTQIFAEWTAETVLPELLSSAIPAYLLAVKEEFDRNYKEEFSLDTLASRHRVNKYRLCKEFSKYYFMSPIKYLNYVRIQNAGLLLVSTDLPVGEIGAMVGIENPNHLIRLFKAQTGMTPLEYRQRLV